MCCIVISWSSRPLTINLTFHLVLIILRKTQNYWALYFTFVYLFNYELLLPFTVSFFDFTLHVFVLGAEGSLMWVNNVSLTGSDFSPWLMSEWYRVRAEWNVAKVDAFMDLRDEQCDMVNQPSPMNSSNVTIVHSKKYKLWLIRVFQEKHIFLSHWLSKK